ncbi:hypothetical protein [Dysgonomonas termitidis]|uniref:Uncharacterized protein n=1 Tax=Dysgonomonas termitidis TaxID=1516126 RepID=A0ABV9L343_9BACT
MNEILNVNSNNITAKDIHGSNINQGNNNEIPNDGESDETQLYRHISKIETDIEKINGKIKRKCVFFWISAFSFLFSLITICGFFVSKDTVIVEESIVLVIVGVLATFIVVGNYYQVDRIEDKFSDKLKDIKAEIQYLIEKNEKVLDEKIKEYKSDQSIPVTHRLNIKINEMVDSINLIRSTPFKNKVEMQLLIDKAYNARNLYIKYIEENRIFIDLTIVSYAQDITNEVNRYITSLHRIILLLPRHEELDSAIKNSTEIENNVFNNKIPDLQRKIDDRFREIYTK